MNDFRQYIKEAHLKDDENYEFVLNDDKLKMYFYIFNDKYFDNKLKGIQLNCVTINTASNKNELGDLQTKIDTDNNVIINECININVDRINNYQTFTNALVHEMLHYYINVFYPPKQELWDEVHKFLRKNKGDKSFIESKVEYILKQDQEQVHKGKWKEMADELNNKYKELNISESVEGDFVDIDFINDYINNYRLLYHNKKEVYILNKNNEKYKNILITIEKGNSKNIDFDGDWYELKVNTNVTLFNNFIIKTGLTEEGMYCNNNIIDLGINLKAFTLEKIGHVNVEIEESVSNDEIYKHNIEILKNITFHIE